MWSSRTGLVRFFDLPGFAERGGHICERRASAQLGRPCTTQQERSDWWGQLRSQVRKPSLRQIVRANENRPIHFGVAGNIFPAHLLLNGLAVGSEHLEFIFAVSLEMIVQGFAADGAAHPGFAI